MKANSKRLKSLNDIFGDSNTNENSVTLMDVEKLIPFSKHPFKLYTGARLDDMVKSVQELGVLMPILVRDVEDGQYEILSGHNRWNAAKLANKDKVPVRIMDNIDDEMAMLIVTETNLIQRSFNDLCPSERACVLAQHYDAVKKQGKRMDLINEINKLLNAYELGAELTSGPVVQKLDSREKIAENYDMSGRNVTRYIRLNLLSNKLKNFLDLGKISIRAGVELSYLNHENQSYLAGFLDMGNNIDLEKAKKLRELQKNKKLNEMNMQKVLNGSYNTQKPKSILKGYKIDSKTMKRYFKENQSEKEVKEILEAALEMYFNAHQGGA